MRRLTAHMRKCAGISWKKEVTMVVRDLFQAVGNTPMLALREGDAHIFLKLECFNPTGSVKDRVAKAMIEVAEKRRLLRPDSVIIEPTSGNMGISLAAFSAARGYRCLLVMPETMSLERRKLLAAYGAQVVLTPGEEGMAGAVAKARELAREYGNSFLPMQFENPANPQAHYKTTAPEIAADVKRVDVVVCGVGTGGTLTGVARYFSEFSPAHIVAVEPASSPVLSGGKAGKHGIQGIGAGFLPPVLDRSLIGEIVTVTDDEARSEQAGLARNNGIFVGFSSGAALAAARRVAFRREMRGKNIVAVLPDSGDRYLSLL